MDNIGIIAIAIVPLLIFWFTGIHKVEEGHVGIYFRGGAIMEGTTDPGYHIMLPLVTEFHNVQVNIQTDHVRDIPCGTSGGVVIYFESIEVVNRLKKEAVFETIKNYTIHYDKTWVFDKIHHEINQFCSKSSLQDVYIDKFDTLDESLREALVKDISIWAPGIEIIAIRVTKPRIPKHV
jgi:regulator of protease activity HflC (stomatin/prohibitin superfamily)